MRFRKKRHHVNQEGLQEVEAIIKSTLREQGQSYKYEEWRVFGHWPTVVGDVIAKQTVPVSLSSTGVLRVEVAHAVYSNELSMMKPMLLQKLSELLERENVVVDIRFHYNPNCMKTNKKHVEQRLSDASETQSDSEVTSLSPDDIQKIEAAVAEVRDVELRAALQALFETKCLAKRN